MDLHVHNVDSEIVMSVDGWLFCLCAQAESLRRAGRSFALCVNFHRTFRGPRLCQPAHRVLACVFHVRRLGQRLMSVGHQQLFKDLLVTHDQALFL